MMSFSFLKSAVIVFRQPHRGLARHRVPLNDCGYRLNAHDILKMNARQKTMIFIRF
jgi:hypothetical protein